MRNTFLIQLARKKILKVDEAEKAFDVGRESLKTSNS